MGDKKMPESLRDQAHDLIESISDEKVLSFISYLRSLGIEDS